MAHVRQQVRDAVVTAVTGLATTGASVFNTRKYPIDTVPSLVVRTPAEAVDHEPDVVGGVHFRRLAVVVEARAKAVANVEDTLDTICAEVEAALAADITLGGVTEDLEIEETVIEFDAEAEQPTALATMTWRSMYRVDATDPTTVAT